MTAFALARCWPQRRLRRQRSETIGALRATANPFFVQITKGAELKHAAGLAITRQGDAGLQRLTGWQASQIDNFIAA